MSAARESASLVFWMKAWFKGPHWRKGQWCNLRRTVRSPYFWQDNLLTPWNRLIGCRLRGHRHVKNIDLGNGESQDHCFNCYRYLPGEEHGYTTNQVG